MKKEQKNNVLLIDVRDPMEIMFTGFSDEVDVNIPFKLSNPKKWNEKQSVFMMKTNPDFEKDIEKGSYLKRAY